MRRVQGLVVIWHSNVIIITKALKEGVVGSYGLEGQHA